MILQSLISPMRTLSFGEIVRFAKGRYLGKESHRKAQSKAFKALEAHLLCTKQLVFRYLPSYV